MKCAMCSNELNKDHEFILVQEGVEVKTCGHCFVLVRIYETLQDIKNVLGEEESNVNN